MRGKVARRAVAWPSVLVMVLAASSCMESANERAQEAASRARTQASTRESETVQRASTPGDPHRILYHAPTDLSETSARATNAAIVGIQHQPQPTEQSADSGSGRVKPPR
jgi:hypothetical protein